MTQRMTQRHSFPPQKAKSHRKRHIPCGPAGNWFQTQQSNRPPSSEHGDEEDYSQDDVNLVSRSAPSRSNLAFYSPAWMYMQVSLNFVTPSLPTYIPENERYQYVRPHVPERYLLIQDIHDGKADWKLPGELRLLVLIESIQSLSDHLWTVELADETGTKIECWIQPKLVQEEEQRPMPQYIRPGLVWLLKEVTVLLVSRDQDDEHEVVRMDRMLLATAENIEQVWTPADAEKGVSDTDYVKWMECRSTLGNQVLEQRAKNDDSSKATGRPKADMRDDESDEEECTFEDLPQSKDRTTVQAQSQSIPENQGTHISLGERVNQCSDARNYPKTALIVHDTEAILTNHQKKRYENGHTNIGRFPAYGHAPPGPSIEKENGDTSHIAQKPAGVSDSSMRSILHQNIVNLETGRAETVLPLTNVHRNFSKEQHCDVDHIKDTNTPRSTNLKVTSSDTVSHPAGKNPSQFTASQSESSPPYSNDMTPNPINEKDGGKRLSGEKSPSTKRNKQKKRKKTKATPSRLWSAENTDLMESLLGDAFETDEPSEKTHSTTQKSSSPIEGQMLTSEKQESFTKPNASILFQASSFVGMDMDELFDDDDA